MLYNERVHVLYTLYVYHIFRSWTVLIKLCSKHVPKEPSETNGHILISWELIQELTYSGFMNERKSILF